MKTSKSLFTVQMRLQQKPRKHCVCVCEITTVATRKRGNC